MARGQYENDELEPITPQIQADAQNIPKGQLDCGIPSFGWCTGEFCLKFANLKTFIVILSISSVLQGAVETYFRISVKEVALEYSFDNVLTDWLLVSAGIFQGVFALLVVFWAFKLHPMSWLGGVIMFQAASSVITIIPTISDPNLLDYMTEQNPQEYLCPSSSNYGLKEPPEHTVVTIILLFIFQLFIGLGSIVLYAVGITYIDNNAETKDCPALIGITIGARIWGSQIGTALSLAVTASGFGWWFGWAILAPIILVPGILLSLFPKKLVRTVIKQAAHRIIEATTNTMTRAREYGYLDDTGFLPSLRRLLTNKILMFNLVGLIFIQVATVNFFLQEQSYLQSRFYLPTDESNGLLDEWLSRFMSYLLRPPIQGICILVAGLIISKFHPSARSMTGWNIAIGIITVIFFVGYIFIECSKGAIAGAYRGKVIQPFCSSSCSCSNILHFIPVCPENSTQTYFSPCHAGCSKQASINDFTIFEGCTCAQDTEVPITSTLKATEGPCNLGKCQLMWIIFQILTVFSAALLGTTFVSKTIISLRSVLPQDKSLALALELFLTSIMTYVSGKLSYDAISNKTCQYWSQDFSKCLLQESPTHGDLINTISAILIFSGVIFDILVFVVVKELNCYPNLENEEEEVDPGFGVPLEPFRRIPQNGAATYQRYTSEIENGNTNLGNLRTDPVIESQRLQPFMRPLVILPSPGAKKVIVENGPRSISPTSSNSTILTHNNGNNMVTYAQVARQLSDRSNNDIRSDYPLDFRMQTPPNTANNVNMNRPPQFDSSDSNSQRSESPYIRELKARQQRYHLERQQSNKDGVIKRPQTPETDF